MRTGAAYDLVHDRLTEHGSIIREIPDGFMAQCPAHPDRNPSLHITSGAKGAVMQCHAGCSTVDILAAIGLTEADLFNEPLPARAPPAALTPMRVLPVPEAVAEYLYVNAASEPVMKVVRYLLRDPQGAVIGKTFRQQAWTPSGWIPKIGDLEPPLYHLPEVLAATNAGVPVMIVEGEKDVDTLRAHGHKATCNPMGAGKWRPQHTAAVAGGHVVIIADDDPPGHRHALAVQKAVAGVAASVVTALPAIGCKDVSEHLEAGRTISELRIVDLATLPRSDGLFGAGRVRGMTGAAFKPGRVRWGWQGRMPIGELTLIPGREGVGKSLFLAWLTGMLTRGELPGEFLGDPRAVLYIASEDDWGYTIVPRMLAAGADLDLVYRVEAYEADMLDRLCLPRDCDELAELAGSLHAGAIMLDPIISLIDDSLSVNQARELRQALEPLRRAAGRAGVILPALAHFNKMTEVDVLSKIPGARAWTEVARAAFGLAEDRDVEDGEPRRYVASQIKNNLGRIDLPNLTYRIDEVFIPTDDGDASVGRWVLTGETDVSVEEILSRKIESRRPRETSEATNQLADFVISYGHTVGLPEIYAAFPLMKPNSVRQALIRLVERGTLRKVQHGHYAGPIDD